MKTNEQAATHHLEIHDGSMSFWQNGALPFQLVQFDELADLEPGTKVRFLCCVDHYDTRTATLVVHERHPQHTAPCVLIDATHVLESLSSVTTQTGARLNVIGSRCFPTPDKASGHARRNAVRIQAVTVWFAGAVKDEMYREALSARRNAIAMMKDARAVFEQPTT